MVICLERGVNYLHMVHRMPLPSHHLCFSKIQNGAKYILLVLVYPGSPGKKAVKRMRVCFHYFWLQVHVVD